MKKKVTGKPRAVKEGKSATELSSRIKLLENKIAKQSSKQKKTEKRINEFLEIIQCFSKFDLKVKAKISDRGDHFDALAVGINMLGEELESSIISLAEKEILLKEIHHRVKNNLQIVSSLLNLQSNLVEDPEVQLFFDETRGRVKSMALVHEKLYNSKDISTIDFALYLQTLSEGVGELFDPNKKTKTTLCLNAEHHFLKVDHAIPCGLIVNELLMNSYKYAFPGNEQGGKIELSFFKKEPGLGKKENFILEVSDNGIGLPDNFKIGETNSLGLQLVEMLTEQVDGKLFYDGKKGASFRIEWSS
ncbi:MAG: sensor histidine kinase [Bacteroidia bacterium]|nr:sensor histidine kinase [Bacteroidia bacterium]